MNHAERDAERAEFEKCYRLTIHERGDTHYEHLWSVWQRAWQASRATAIPGAHELFKTGDADCPHSILDANGEVVLGLCRRCNKAEVQLSEPCVAPPPQPDRIRECISELEDVRYGMQAMRSFEIHYAYKDAIRTAEDRLQSIITKLKTGAKS